jgi:hypothetical protein
VSGPAYEPTLKTINRRAGCLRCLADQQAGKIGHRRTATTLVCYPDDRRAEPLCGPHLADWRTERRRKREAVQRRGPA